MSRLARQLTQQLGQQFGPEWRLRWPLRRKFFPMLATQTRVGPYLIRTAQTTQDLQDIFRLRVHTAGVGSSRMRMHLDEEDWLSDHLMIFHTGRKQLAGAVRVRSSFLGHVPTLGKEFHLRRFLVLPGEKLEVTRLRLHPDYQQNLLTNLLWRSLADLMGQTKSQYAFGSVSLALANPRQAALLYHYFSERGRFRERMFCPPRREHSMSNLDLWIFSLRAPLTDSERSEAEHLLSPILQSYLRAGAFLGGEPAWDVKAQTIDFLTILHRDDLNRALWRRFELTSEPSIA